MRHAYGTAALAFLAHIAERLSADIDFVAILRAGVDEWCWSVIPKGADGQVARAARRLALVAVAGEMATDAQITGWPIEVASDAARRIFQDWLAERGGIGSREGHYLETVFRRFMELHESGRFTVVDPPGRRSQPRLDEPQADQPLSEKITLNRAGFRWQDTNDKGERFWTHGILPAVFEAEIAGAPQVHMSPGEAKKRLAANGLIETFSEGVKTRYDTKSHRIHGAQYRLIIVRRDIID